MKKKIVHVPLRAELNLPIKAMWLSSIVFGWKNEEYRSASNAQVRRLFNRFYDRFGHNFFRPFVAVLRAGYSMRSQAAAVLVDGLDLIRTAPGREPPPKHPEWGEPPGDHFVLHIGSVIKTASYADVKEWMNQRGGLECKSGT